MMSILWILGDTYVSWLIKWLNFVERVQVTNTVPLKWDFKNFSPATVGSWFSRCYSASFYSLFRFMHLFSALKSLWMCKTLQTFRDQGPRIQDITVLQNSFKKTNVVHLILSHGDKRKKISWILSVKKFWNTVLIHQDLFKPSELGFHVFVLLFSANWALT